MTSGPAIATGERKDSFMYDKDRVYYPYYHPDSDGLRKVHQSFHIRLPVSETNVQPEAQGGDGKDERFYRTFHRDLKYILKRTDLRAHRYTFAAADPDSGREVVHSVLWDYETGHVRISPMFKSSEFDALRKKNTPRRCVTRNGLNDCYASITGGNIEAQGFWIPYLAAKAMCTRFCYTIRHALSPIFGNDFPALCERARNEIMSMGKTYGSEETLQIEDSIVQAVKAKQAVVEWQIYVEEGVTRTDRQEKLPPVEEAWKKYLASCKGLPIPPRLSYPEASGSQTEEQIEAASILMELKYGHFWPGDVLPRSQSSC
ncbi:hypothetical protein Dda_8002 [Drechslerella dactyloides]|uniref:HTH APSES-type domain-containing protein n=1 Tax=Drechslerella dactyloides TaxID=74499 RepID=A0AAD6IRK6_DREDA|nr:hypothetical protein Dda_8002 [Drechslerella dactyloides]